MPAATTANAGNTDVNTAGDTNATAANANGTANTRCCRWQCSVLVLPPATMAAVVLAVTLALVTALVLVMAEPAGLSLRAGDREFSPATTSLSPGCFDRYKTKILEREKCIKLQNYEFKNKPIVY